ncbi:MAG: acyl-CoA-binding protein [Candidatus Helarchaeota archaeon]|nr:acyl-CoA-binding protein [Candidatus Helarchaeota archaeon]
MSEEVVSSLKAQFEDAVRKSNSLSKQPVDIQLELYGLYKQVTIGDVRGERPGRRKVRARAKYDAWTSRKGMSKETAMKEYIELVNKLEKSEK